MSIGDHPTQRPAWGGAERRHGRDDEYSGPERRRRGLTEGNLHDLHVIRRFESIEDRLDKGSERMKAIELELRDNTTTTREVRDLLEIGRSGFKVLGWMGVLAKWIAAVAGAAAAIWGLLHLGDAGGVKPPGH